MANVGDRIAVASKGKPRFGVVTAVGGAMIRVRWDTGGETSLVPAPGVLSVVTGRRSTQSRPTRRPSGAASAVRKKAVAAKKTARSKPVVRKKAVAAKKTARSKPVVRKKAAPRKKQAAKPTSSTRRTGKKTR